MRKSNPVREVIVGPTTWNNVNDLDRLQLPESDRHLIVTVHYYNPFQFTHQGSSGRTTSAELAGHALDGFAR